MFLSDRKFAVRLRRDTGIFHPDLVVETTSGTLHYDTSRAYVGHLTGTSFHLHVTRADITVTVKATSNCQLDNV